MLVYQRVNDQVKLHQWSGWISGVSLPGDWVFPLKPEGFPSQVSFLNHRATPNSPTHPKFKLSRRPYPWFTGWWFQPTPLKNDGVRQLGWLFHSQYDGKVIIQPCSSHHQPAMVYHGDLGIPLFWFGKPPFPKAPPKNARNATAGAMARAHLCSEHNLLKVSCQHLVRFEPRLIPKRTDWLWLAPYFCCGSAMTWIFLGKRSILAPVQSHLKPQRNTTWREQPWRLWESLDHSPGE